MGANQVANFPVYIVSYSTQSYKLLDDIALLKTRNTNRDKLQVQDVNSFDYYSLFFSNDQCVHVLYLGGYDSYLLPRQF